MSLNYIHLRLEFRFKTSNSWIHVCGRLFSFLIRVYNVLLLIHCQDSEIIEQIDRDVKRTHPDMHFFSGDSSFAKSNQVRICHSQGIVVLR